MAIYYGKIAYADAQMRRLYNVLGARGLLENTWVIISSDHGDYLGEKGLVAKTESLYECLLHVPLIITPPHGMPAPCGEKISGFVDLVDLFPTLLEIAGLPVPDYTQGKDLLAWARDGAREPLRDAVYAQVGDYHGHLKTTWPAGMPAAGRHPGLLQGVRTKEFSFVRDPDYGDEAYDLRHDPRELENLLGREGVEEPSEVSSLRRRVDQWEEQCVRLRERLEIAPGYRGFDFDWMTKHGDRPR
jgi:arylsulfatase A-like enzyme